MMQHVHAALLVDSLYGNMLCADVMCAAYSLLPQSERIHHSAHAAHN